MRKTKMCFFLNSSNTILKIQDTKYFLGSGKSLHFQKIAVAIALFFRF